ncbi:MAG: hypothetical protein ACE1Y4_00240 [Lysobacterales bacterium]
MDQGLLKTTENGSTIFAYGGDFGTENGCGWAARLPLRAENPHRRG